MTTTAADLAAYVGSATATDFVASCVSEAAALVTAYVGGTVDSDDDSLSTVLYAAACPVPDVIADRAVLETAKALYDRRANSQAPTGYDTAGQPQAAVPARDPMASAYSMLKRYLGLGFA